MKKHLTGRQMTELLKTKKTIFDFLFEGTLEKRSENEILLSLDIKKGFYYALFPILFIICLGQTIWFDGLVNFWDNLKKTCSRNILSTYCHRYCPNEIVFKRCEEFFEKD